MHCVILLFFKQKTAYELRISDWSSDVCSSDLADVKSDTEIWFDGSTVLDNGIEFGVNVQLEGNSDSDQIDESFLTVAGWFGKVIVGSENSAMYLLHVAPKDFGFGLNTGDTVEWVDFSGVGGAAGARKSDG